MSPVRAGPYQRAVTVAAVAGGPAVAEMEDDFHHFLVTVAAEDGRIVHIAGEAVRHPWSLCPAAALQLQAFLGAPVTADPAAIGEHADIRQQCTHMFDLAGLAVAALAAGDVQRRYDVVVGDSVDGVRDAALWRDGVAALAWRADYDTLRGPESVAGVSLKRPFVDWARASLAPDLFEAALVMRRALFVAKGRDRDPDARATAADGARTIGGCFVMQPERASHALRIRGSTLSFPFAGPGPLPPGT